AAAGALDRVALYTGNDDHILLDLTLPFDLRDQGVTVRTHIPGGLLGHWSVWTQSAIGQFERCKAARNKETVPREPLALDARVTDCNSAFFDVANNFHGCIAGCHEVLRRQGLMAGIRCLDPNEGLSPGQIEEIDRVYREHADLSDDDFVAAHLDKWLALRQASASSACAMSARSIVLLARSTSPSPTSPWTCRKASWCRWSARPAAARPRY